MSRSTLRPPLTDVITDIFETHDVSETYCDPGTSAPGFFELLKPVGEHIEEHVLTSNTHSNAYRTLDELQDASCVSHTARLSDPQPLPHSEPADALIETHAPHTTIQEHITTSVNEATNRSVLPGVRVHSVQNAVLYGPEAIAATPGGSYLLSEAQANTWYLAAEISSAVADYHAHTNAYSDPETLGTVLPLTGFCTRNYYHWLIDYLPKLRAAEHYYACTGEMPTLLISNTESDWQRKILDALGYGEHVTVWDGHCARVSELLVTHGAHPRHDSAVLQSAQLEWVHEHVLQNIDSPRTSFPTHLYLSRDAHARRSVANRDALLDALPRSFTAVQPETLSFADQVAMFRDADVVIAPHGAALANTAWSRDVTVIELFGALQRDAYYQLATGLHHTYAAVTSSTTETEDGRATFTVDVDAVTRICEQLL